MEIIVLFCKITESSKSTGTRGVPTILNITVFAIRSVEIIESKNSHRREKLPSIFLNSFYMNFADLLVGMEFYHLKIFLEI